MELRWPVSSLPKKRPMSKRAFIFGAGGHARVIASMISATSTFLVEGPETKDDELLQDEFFDHLGDYMDCEIYIAIGDNAARKRYFERLKACGARVSNCIAGNAFVAGDAQLGEGVVICPGSVVGARARIGDNTIINTLSSVDHDCVLGDHSQVTAGVTFGGTVTVGTNCFFGIKSAVIPNITIGDNVSVMAGSLVVQDVPSNVVVGGNPARVMRTLAGE